MWDGYNAERKSLMQFLASGGIRNVVSLSGNIGAFMAGPVMDDFDATTPQPVMVDLVTAGVSGISLNTQYEEFLNGTAQTQAWVDALLSGSGLAPFGTSLQTNNPWLGYLDPDAQGYAIVTLTPAALTCTFTKMNPIAGGQVPAANNAIAGTQVVTVNANTPAVQVASA
jgi:alkaline phosphatase D